MSHIRIKIILMLSVLLVLSVSTIYAQNNPEEGLMIDSIDQGENLLDSNLIYKKMFDSLSTDGEWVKAGKADFIRELTEGTNEFEEDDYYYGDDYIYVWRPYCAVSGWTPYTNGSWVFTSYGWVWFSDYSWGWGPYNYGRWYHSAYYGWVWMPGCRWAANWVTWRYTNNYYGWYPTCPKVYWYNPYNNICYNTLYAYNPISWWVVKKGDITKEINSTVLVSKYENADILKHSQKFKIHTYNEPGKPIIKYTGPDVSVINVSGGEKITPKEIVLTSRFDDEGSRNTPKQVTVTTTSLVDQNNTSVKDDINVRTSREDNTITIPRSSDENTKPKADDYNTSRTGTKDNNTGRESDKDIKTERKSTPQVKDSKGSKNSRKSGTTKKSDKGYRDLVPGNSDGYNGDSNNGSKSNEGSNSTTPPPPPPPPPSNGDSNTSRDGGNNNGPNERR